MRDNDSEEGRGTGSHTFGGGMGIFREKMQLFWQIDETADNVEKCTNAENYRYRCSATHPFSGTAADASAEEAVDS